LDVSDASDLLGLAQAEFEAENYGEALRLSNDALLANEAATPVVRPTLANYFKKHSIEIIVLIAVLAIVSKVSVPKIQTKIRSNKLESLKRERDTTKSLMKEADENRYVKKSVGQDEYEKARRDHEKRLAEIEREITLAEGNKIKKNKNG